MTLWQERRTTATGSANGGLLKKSGDHRYKAMRVTLLLTSLRVPCLRIRVHENRSRRYRHRRRNRIVNGVDQAHTIVVLIDDDHFRSVRRGGNRYGVVSHMDRRNQHAISYGI